MAGWASTTWPCAQCQASSPSRCCRFCCVHDQTVWKRSSSSSPRLMSSAYACPSLTVSSFSSIRRTRPPGSTYVSRKCCPARRARSETSSTDSLTGAGDGSLTGATDDVLTGATDDVLTGATDDVLTGATDDVLTGATDDVLTGATDDVLTGA